MHVFNLLQFVETYGLTSSLCQRMLHVHLGRMCIQLFLSGVFYKWLLGLSYASSPLFSHWFLVWLSCPWLNMGCRSFLFSLYCSLSLSLFSLVLLMFALFILYSSVRISIYNNDIFLVNCLCLLSQFLFKLSVFVYCKYGTLLSLDHACMKYASPPSLLKHMFLDLKCVSVGTM